MPPETPATRRPVYRLLQDFSFRRLIQAQLLLMLISGIALISIAVWTIDATRIEGKLYRQIAEAIELEADVLPPRLYLIEAHMTANRLMSAPEEDRQVLLEQLYNLQNVYRERLVEWKNRRLPTDLQASLERNTVHANLYLQRLDAFILAVRRDENQIFDSLLAYQRLGELQEAFAEHRAQVSLLAEQSAEHARDVEGRAKELLRQRYLLLALVSLLVIGLSVIFMRTLGRQIAARTDRVVAAAEQVAQGQIEQPLAIDACKERDEITRILDAVEAMRASLYGQITQLAAQHQALAASKTALEKHEQLKNNFLANISHELRTPLNGILGMLQLLAYADLDSDNRSLVVAATESANDLHQLIENLLYFIDLRARGQQYDHHQFMVTDLIHGLNSRFESAAAGKGLNLETRIAADMPPTLVAQLDSLTRALAALLDNAVKFTRSGGIRLSVSAQAIADTTGKAGQGRRWKCQFSVADTGPGIPAEQQAALFGLFSQVDGSITRAHGGTGIGLATVAGVAEMMGGSIRYEDSPGGGACFILEAELPERLQSHNETASPRRS